MREIKFRAWNCESKTMGESFTLQTAIGSRSVQGVVTDGVVYMQFTGLKDTNGAEIYEGDIVKHGVDSWPVFYEGGAVCLKKNVWFSDNESEKFVIIGNIYENPELLEVK